MGTIFALPSPASSRKSASPLVIDANTKSPPPPPPASTSPTSTLAIATSPLLASASAFVPLSHAINTATRPLHNTLNDLITARLPLCLPPHATDPVLYLAGLEALLFIFEAIETAFARLTTDAEPLCTNSAAGGDTTTLVDALATLLPKGLPRAPRLRHDTIVMREHLRAKGVPALRPSPSMAQDASCSEGHGELGALLHAYAAHLSITAAERPHELLAYAWVMYMGVLSGGRWIRAQIDASVSTNAATSSTAATVFWPVPATVPFCAMDDEHEAAPTSDEGDVSSHTSADPGRTFLRFAHSTHDGEDIKRAFRARFAAADAALPPELRDDVVREAEVAFTWIVRLVAALDGVAAEAAATTAAVVRGDADVKAERRWGEADVVS